MKARLLRLVLLAGLVLFFLIPFGVTRAQGPAGPLIRLAKAVAELKASHQLPALVEALRRVPEAKRLVATLEAIDERVIGQELMVSGLPHESLVQLTEALVALNTSQQVSAVTRALQGSPSSEALERLTAPSELFDEEAMRQLKLLASQTHPPPWGPHGPTRVRTSVNACKILDHVEFLCKIKHLLETMESPNPEMQARLEHLRNRFKQNWSLVDLGISLESCAREKSVCDCASALETSLEGSCP